MYSLAINLFTYHNNLFNSDTKNHKSPYILIYSELLKLKGVSRSSFVYSYAMSQQN